ncbi:MAG: DoxX family protein [Acidobacteriota bacterium]|nr:DoxX family protein [Acidobacteriota bacterium]
MQTKTLDYGLLIIRIVLGIVMVAHGAQKLFTFGHAGVAGGFAQLGMPAPAIAAALIIAVEFGGGLLMLAGLFTRFAGAAFAFAMLVASVQVHLPNGFFMPTGYEFTLTLGAIALGLALTGPGRFSADALIAGRRTGALPA